METEVTLQGLKDFIAELESRKIRYMVIAGFGLDGKRGHQSRPHQDVDVLCLKADEKKVAELVNEKGYKEKVFNDLHKLYGADGTKIDLCLMTEEGDELVTYGRIAITRFPRVLLDKAQIGRIGKVVFNIAPNEMLKTWGMSSKKGDDAVYAASLPADEKIMSRIKRVLRE